MLENFHDVSMRKRFCEIWNIEMEAHPDTHFSHEELLRRGTLDTRTRGEILVV